MNMISDEQLIRELVQTWLQASKRGDVETVLGLMTDDAVFMVPGREPFGKEAFASAGKQMSSVLKEAASDIREIQVAGDWAWMRNHLRVTIQPPTGQPVVRSGFVLTVLKKNSSGKWQIARDANLLTEEPAG